MTDRSSESIAVENHRRTEDGPPKCANCGTVVSPDYHRVFSDDDEVLQHCYACASRTERY